ncbi:MAG TPA: response regulator, partial [Candidatus Xenobia bacterium]
PVGRPKVRPLDILVAEDDPVSQRYLVHALQRQGHTVRVVGDGQELLCAWEAARADVILMDMNMPGMDGWTAMRLLREREKQGRVPIVALTASAMKGDKERCISAGADAYLPKPVLKRDLLALLDTLCAA